MNLHKVLFTQSDCYRAGRTIVPRGVMVHSTGANNPNLRRYVAPNDGLLGEPSLRHWNQPGVTACVHAFIGRLADGTVAAYQVLPWTCRGWHAGGAANNTHISFEICEDDLEDAGYFSAVYREAVELTAHLCREYGLDPLADGVVICHAEGHQLGVASNHADVLHWFPRFGKTMDDFRADVAQEMEGTVTQEQFNAMMDAYLQQLAAKGPNSWSLDARAWAESRGMISGDGSGSFQYQKFCTREELIQILYAMEHT